MRIVPEGLHVRPGGDCREMGRGQYVVDKRHSSWIKIKSPATRNVKAANNYSNAYRRCSSSVSIVARI